MPWIGTLPPYFCTRKVENDRAPAFAQLYCAGRQTALCFGRKSTRKQNHIMLVLINLLALGLMAATIAIPATIIFNIYRATHEDYCC